MHFDFRASLEPDHFIVGEVGLYDGALVDRDLAVQGGGQAVDDRAFDLRLHAVRIHGHSGVGGGDNSIDFQIAVLADRYVGDMGHHGAEAFDDGDAASLTFRNRR